ncbi:MAG: extensin family protein [Alphaproteobacteria bacterium]|nr:extensin family protein [Alphaproteobacteria bacterium]MBV9015074.1 extensin family protein [Alphaproteobacteria bacterium]MBV9154558.1 extensin family protein [Alphaproteobacteria bacterium]MBV9964293.1 extensin family protein [Alphaproteobacteria bacterium]
MPRVNFIAVACGAIVLLLAGCGGAPEHAVLSGRACLARLSAHDVAYRPVDIGDPVDSHCQVDTAVKISRIHATFNHPVTMSCALADRLDEFERDVVQPLALDELGSRASRIDQLGSYSCRRQNSRLAGRWSQHALGQAIDIAGFRLADGTTVSVDRDWSEAGAKGRFLHRLAAKACRYFSVVLTPDSNAEHYNHLHLDIGPDRLCST